MPDERAEIECAMAEKRFDDGAVISGHEYHEEDDEVHVGCTVTVSRCRRCGHVSVGWWYTDRPPMRWKGDANAI